MRVFVANVLTVGVTDRSKALNVLPVRLLLMETGAEAIQCLREERIATVISRWELTDMPQGKFLKKIVAAKPAVPTIAFVTPGDRSQEVAARSLGVSAIVSEDVEDEYFREIVCQVLGIYKISRVKVVDGYSAHIDNLALETDK